MEALSHFWDAIWPNLAANVVWIPIVGIYHLWTRHRFDALHATIRELHAKLDDQRQRRSYPRS